MLRKCTSDDKLASQASHTEGSFKRGHKIIKSSCRLMTQVFVPLLGALRGQA